MLEIAVLGLLNESPLHGYELRKRLSNLLGAFRAFSYGSLYPSLRRLQEAGWITEEAPDSVPGAAVRSRRGKRVYRLTAEGKEHFAALLAEVGPEAYDDEGFGTRLAFFAQTRSDIRLQILEGRKQRMTEQADGMRASLARTRERMDRYSLQLQEHGLDSADREVRWLTELIESEREHPTG
jgi:DNA-binding PadR family transcriptional regulator